MNKTIPEKIKVFKSTKRPNVKKNGARIVFHQLQKSSSLIELLEWENKKEGTGLRVAVRIEELNK